MPQHDPEATAAATEREAVIVRLKREGLTFDEIGQRFGVSKQVVHRQFHRAIRRGLTVQVDAYRDEQLARIEAAREVVMDVLHARHVVVSNGHVVSEITGQDAEGKPIYGEPLVDDGPVLAAVDRLVKLDDQEARLLGLYAAAKVETDTTLRYEVVGVDPGDVV
jgi:hypothetical protein